MNWKEAKKLNVPAPRFKWISRWPEGPKGSGMTLNEGRNQAKREKRARRSA